MSDSHKLEINQQAFYNACKDGDIRLVNILLPTIKNLDFKVNDMSPLYMASANGYVEIVKLLIENKCDVNSTSGKISGTPLHAASIDDHADVAEILIKAGCDIDAISSEANTALHYTAFSNSVDTFELLFGLGANIYIKNKNGEDIFDVATLHDSKDIIKILDEYSSRDSRDFYNACSDGNITLVKQLIHKVDISFDRNGLNALYIATYKRHHDIIKLLIEAKCDVDIQTKLGWTALHVACSNDDYVLVKLLVDAKCDTNLQNKDGETPLHVVYRREAPNISNSAKIVKLLVHAGADLSIPNNLGESVIEIHGSDHLNMIKINAKLYPGTDNNQEDMKTKFFEACRDDIVKCVEKLAPIFENIDFEIYEKNRKLWPLALACLNLNTDTIKILLSYKCDLSKKTEHGYSILHLACSNQEVDKHVEIITMLIDAGCDVNAQTNSGNTPLHFSVFNNSSDIFKVLLDAGADVKLTNIYGYDVLQKAVELKRNTIIGLIENNNNIDKEKKREKEICKTCGQVVKTIT